MELLIADASHDRLSARLLTRCRLANFGSQLGEVNIGRFKDITSFEFGAHGDLEQLRSRQIATFQFVVEVIGEVNLQAWHAPNYTPIRRAHEQLYGPEVPLGTDSAGRDPVEGRVDLQDHHVSDLVFRVDGAGGISPARFSTYPLVRVYVLVELGGIEPPA